MISIAIDKNEYKNSLSFKLDDMAGSLDLATQSMCAITNAYLFNQTYTSETGCIIKLHQYIDIEDDSPFKIIPSLRQAGYDRFSFDLSDCMIDANEKRIYIKQLITDVDSKEGTSRKGQNIIRLVSSDEIPRGVTSIKISNESVELILSSADGLNDVKGFNIILHRYSFVHDSKELKDMKGININEIIGNANNNII